MKGKDLTGLKLKNLRVLEFLGKSRWLCECVCGNKVIRLTSNITKSKNVVSVYTCRLRSSPLVKAGTKHGKYDTRFHVLWKGLKKRCYNPKSQYYRLYGERGITVCDEWKDNAGAFIAWCEAQNPIKGLSLDRIDNNGPRDLKKRTVKVGK